MQQKLLTSLVLGFLTLISLGAWAEGRVYKCKDAEGKFSYQKSACGAAMENVHSWVPVIKSQSPEAAEVNSKQTSPAVLRLEQGASGHFVTNATVNDQALVLVVDTGASVVSLPESIAHNADIYCTDLKVGMDTANGLVEACAAKIKKLQFGPFTIENVPTVIVPHLSQPLLGMNVLQLFKIEQGQGEMLISLQQKKP
jgi:clan AA aspartic protease (TIGR02281 family)